MSFFAPCYQDCDSGYRDDRYWETDRCWDDRRDHRYHRRRYDCGDKVCDGVKLIVYKHDDYRSPTMLEGDNGRWLPNRDGWSAPKIQKRHFEFVDGVVRIHKPGIYNIKSLSGVYIHNGGDVPISGEAQSRIVHRKGRDSDEPLATSIYAAVVPQRPDFRVEPNVTLFTDATVNITCEDIKHCHNEIAIEYMFQVFLIPGQPWPTNIELGQESRDMQNYVVVEKVGDACREK